MTGIRQGIENATVLRRAQGLTYVFDLAAGLPDLPQFCAILDLYESRLGDDPVPYWRDFTFRDLRGWHDRFALYELDRDGYAGRCKLMGEKYRACFGEAVRPGMKLSDTEEPARSHLRDYLARLVTGPMAGYFTGRMSYRGREHVGLDVLDLPARDPDGKTRYVLSFIRAHI